MPDQVRALDAALPSDSRTPSGMTRSETLARRALGLALDPNVTMDQAAARLAALAGAHVRRLELARARILRTSPTGPITDAAVGALQLALRHAETTAR